MSDKIDTAHGPISQAEMVEMFGETMPIEAVQLLFDAPDASHLRAELRKIAEQRSGGVLERQLLRKKAEMIVAQHIAEWGWGPLDELEGLAEHELAVRAAMAGLSASPDQPRLSEPAIPAGMVMEERACCARIAESCGDVLQYGISGETAEDCAQRIANTIRERPDPLPKPPTAARVEITDDQHRGLVERLRGMVSADGTMIVCKDRTTRQMCSDLSEAADAIQSLEARALAAEKRVGEAVLAEREACAAVADDHALTWGLAHASPAIVIAEAIRNRSEAHDER